MNEARYRAAEQVLWSCTGLEPSERRVRLACTGTEVRVQVVGEGPPVLMLHGTPNSGSAWVPLVPHLPGFQCLLVDRPGTGLSDDYQLVRDLTGVSDRLVPELLDGLGFERAHVVASSFGGFLALRAAAAAPQRFDRMVQMSCPALVPGMTIPPFMKPLRSAFVRWLAPRLPASPKSNLEAMRQMGHGAALDAGRFPQAFLDWYLALQRHTHLMRNEVPMIGALMGGPEFDPTRAMDGAVLARVSTPTLFLWGAEDCFGGEAVARTVVAAMPRARLELLPASGHLPWLDDPVGVGARTAAFLEAA